MQCEIKEDLCIKLVREKGEKNEWTRHEVEIHDFDLIMIDLNYPNSPKYFQKHNKQIICLNIDVKKT